MLSPSMTLFGIKGPWTGRLCIVPRPRGSDWLEDTVRSWKSSGLGLVVSALTKEEMAELELGQEAEFCRASEIEFLNYPIEDRGVPESVRQTLQLVQALDARLSEGRSVGIHCRMGVGRSGLLAACCLVLRGAGPKEALERVAEARGWSVPDTEEQREWVGKFARERAFWLAE